MGLEKVRDILKEAQRQNTSVIAFDACDYNTVEACIRGAEAAKKPVIIMLYPTMSKLFSFGAFAATVKDLAKDAAVPVGLHLDHCSDVSMIISAIRDGFTSVMADGSRCRWRKILHLRKALLILQGFLMWMWKVKSVMWDRWQAALITKIRIALPDRRRRQSLLKKPV